jgi:hypothetical protein
MVGGTNITGSYTASGNGPFVGQGGLVVWFLVASLSMILKRDASAPKPVSEVKRTVRSETG